MASEPGREDRPTRVLFCGDREVSVHIVELMAKEGGEIVALGLNTPPGPFAGALTAAAGVDPGRVFYGRSLASEVALRKVAAQAPDLGVCCGFGPILPRRVLDLPRWGWLNVHRSYLPYNRGLDPLQWAVIDGTPAGVSIHFMTEEVDAGPVLVQAEMPVYPIDDGPSLERRADRLAYDLFENAWPRMRVGDLRGTPQDDDLATYHSLADCEAVRRLDRGAMTNVGRLLDILRCYSGGDYPGTYFQLGLLRTRFSVHTEVRTPAQPKNAGWSSDGVTKGKVGGSGSGAG